MPQSCHNITQQPVLVFRKIILNVLYGCICSLESCGIFNLHSAGIICIIIVTVPRGAFAFNISGTLTDLNYLSEDRCVTFEETVHLSQLKFFQFYKLLHIS